MTRDVAHNYWHVNLLNEDSCSDYALFRCLKVRATEVHEYSEAKHCLTYMRYNSNPCADTLTTKPFDFQRTIFDFMNIKAINLAHLVCLLMCGVRYVIV